MEKNRKYIFISIFVLFFVIGVITLFPKQKSIYAESIDLYYDINEEIETIQNEYIDIDGFIDLNKKSEILECIKVYIVNLYENGVITEYSYEEGDTGIYYQIDNWLGCVYSPPIKGMLNGESEDINIITIEPYFSSFEMWLNKNVASIIALFKQKDVLSTDEIAQNIEKIANCYYWIGDYHNSEVDLDLLYNLSYKNSIVIWQGHGDYIKGKGSMLSLGVEKFSQSDILIFQEEFADGSLILLSNGVIEVTSNFFDKHLTESALNGSIFYLNACSSLKDYLSDSDEEKMDSLAQTLLDRGAKCVIGNSDPIHIWYAFAMQSAIFEKLMIPSDNGNFHTVTESINYANEIWGTDIYDNKGSVSYVWAGGEDVKITDINISNKNAVGKDEESIVQQEIEVSENLSLEVLSHEYERFSDGTISNTYFYYDKKGRLICKSYEYYQTKMLYEYDSNNHIVNCKTVDFNDTLIEYQEYNYDEQGREIKKISYDSSDIVNEVLITNYDKVGNISEQVYTANKDGYYDMMETKYEYDANNNCIQKIESHLEDNEVVSQDIYKYEYDVNNNCICRTVVFGITNSICTYEYDDYNFLVEEIEHVYYSIDGKSYMSVETTNYVRDLDGKVLSYTKSIKSNDGVLDGTNTIIYEYNKNGQLMTEYYEQTGRKVFYEYVPLGEVQYNEY